MDCRFSERYCFRYETSTYYHLDLVCTKSLNDKDITMSTSYIVITDNYIKKFKQHYYTNKPKVKSDSAVILENLIVGTDKKYYVTYPGKSF